MQAPGQVQRGSGEGFEGSGEGLEGFSGEPGQVQQGCGEGFEEGSGRLWCQSQVRFNSILEKVSVKFWEALLQSQASIESGSEKVLGSFGAEPGQVQQGCVEGPGEGRRLSRSGSTGFRNFGAKPGQVQQSSEEGSGEGLGGFGVEPGQIQGHLTHGNPAEVFPALGF